MALTIDQRLLEPDGEMELMENFNRVLNIVDEIESLPDADDATEGDILTINEDGEAEWTTPTSGSGSALPDSSEANEGDVLSINSDGEAEWTQPAVALPDATEASEGDVLSINSDGEAEWTTPTGGSGSSLPSVTASDEGKFLVVNASGQWVATTIPIADNMSF